ncbi:MAG: recombinase family protein, partial [Lachnospiraceae bacterium]|nr:recombinase family protein [Lachnospiraceae bacterium]
MRAVIYARYSSDRQTEDSIHAQVRACEEYAGSHGMQILRVYKDEAISGRESKTEMRKAYQQMLQDCKAHAFDTILIHKYDRVARSLSEHVNLETRLMKEGIELVAVAQNFGTSNESKIMRTLLWSMSEYYSDNLSSETKKGHRETALKALHNGGVAPFGYDIVDQKYVINEFEAEYVRRMFQCELDGTGFKGLIAEMKAAGIKGKRGKEIHYTQIYEILRNERYCGVYLYSPTEAKDRSDRRSKPDAIRIDDAFPAIINKTMYQEVQKIMDSHKRRGKKNNYLCSGLVYCASCGAKMHVYKRQKKGHEYMDYRCSAACGSSMVRVEDVDAAAKAFLGYILSDDTQEKIAQLLRTYKGHEKDRVDSFKKAIAKQIAEKDASYENLLANLSSAVLPAEVVKDLTARMQTLKNEIEALKQAEPPKDYTVDMVKEWLQSIKDAPDEKAVHLLIARIEAKREKDNTDFNIVST